MSPPTRVQTGKGRWRYTPATYSYSYIARRPHKVFLMTSWNGYTKLEKKGYQTVGLYAWLGFGFSTFTTPVLSNNDYNELLSRLAAKAKGHTFNMGVAMGEGRQTGEMVVATLNRFTSAIKAVRKGRLDLAARALGASPRGSHSSRNQRKLKQSDISSVWLELKYGWMPLLQDIHESAKAYSALANKARRTRISATVYAPIFASIPHASGAKYFTRVYSGKVERKITAELTEQLSIARSLGLVDPRSVAWELVPFSFVADWFIPIGTYLDNLSTIPHLSARFLETNRTSYNVTTTPGSDLTFQGAFASGDFFSFTRSVPSSLSVPPPQFKDIKSALSVGHIQNGIALLHNLITS